MVTTNWKEYLLNKFSDEKKFKIEQFDREHISFEKFRVTSKDHHCETEIVFQIFKDTDFSEVFDVHFNNPNSPALTDSNINDKYGFDGINSTFNKENEDNMNDLLDIPLRHGWTERTFFYDGKEIKTECIWKRDGNLLTIPIKQNYLDNIGCLLFPLAYLKIVLTNHKLKNKTKAKQVDQVIKPMLEN